jgi:hypothetical protein
MRLVRPPQFIRISTAPTFLRAKLSRRFEAILIRHITDLGQRLPTESLNFGDGSFRLCRATTAWNNVRACLGQRLADNQSYPACSADHDGGYIGEVKGRRPSMHQL